MLGWVNAGLGLVYPEVCQVCGSARATVAERFLCAGCLGKVKPIRPPYCSRCGLPYEGAITGTFECGNCREAGLEFAFARSAVVAGEEVLQVIHQYKYKRAYWFEPLLAEWLIRATEPELHIQSWHRLVPIPLYPAKEREREFNQAERLAKRLSRALGIPVDSSCVRRVRATESQTRLSREERHQNMHKAFEAKRGAGLEGQRLVLIDDVMTTGATTSACAKALRKAGAAEVCVWTVARGV